jgi:hypothetical protein
MVIDTDQYLQPYYLESPTGADFAGKAVSRALHHCRHALNRAWIDKMKGADRQKVLVQLTRDIAAFGTGGYDPTKFTQPTVLDDFELFYLYALILTGQRDFIAEHQSRFSTTYRDNGYGYYAELKRFLIAISTGSGSCTEITGALGRFRPTRMFYCPTQAFLEACSTRDEQAIARETTKTNKRFSGYAAKCSAMVDGRLVIRSMNDHYLFAIPESAVLSACGLEHTQIEWLL